jgi:putative NADPH-quinone reductase
MCIYTSGTRAQAHTQMFGKPFPGARKYPKHLLFNMCKRVFYIWVNLFFVIPFVFMCSKRGVCVCVCVSSFCALPTLSLLSQQFS